MKKIFPIRGAIATFLAIALTPACVLAADLTVVSQNALHYGWGSTNPNKWSADGTDKVAKLWGNLSQGGVGLLQEVMPAADASKFIGCVGVCKVYASPTLYGRGWYKEKYYFVVTDIATLKPALIAECADVLGTGNCPFSRPPASILLKPASGAKIWVSNFHAVWGKSKSLRTAEAANTPTLTAGLIKKEAGSNWIIGGDWNLTAGEVSAARKCSVNCAAPTGNTTLKADGSDTSSSYDHFVSSLQWKSNSVLPANPDNKTWRLKTSDHLGVIATFIY